MKYKKMIKIINEKYDYMIIRIRQNETADFSIKSEVLNSLIKYFYLTAVLFFMLIGQSGISFAQSNRSILNKGVDKYDEKKYTDAEVEFRKVVESSPKSFEANYNLGNSYYKQGKYDDAIKSYQSAYENSKDNDSRAKIFHNIGNSLLKSNKLEQSVEAYKNALKFNPNDEETKYNLSYALELLKNQNKNDKDKNDQNKNDQNKQDKQQQKNQDQNNKEQDQKNQQNQQPQQPKDQEAKQDNTQQQQSKDQKISKDEAQRILDALKNNEKDLQKQLRKVKVKVRKTDKDW